MRNIFSQWKCRVRMQIEPVQNQEPWKFLSSSLGALSHLLPVASFMRTEQSTHPFPVCHIHEDLVQTQHHSHFSIAWVIFLQRDRIHNPWREQWEDLYKNNSGYSSFQAWRGMQTGTEKKQQIFPPLWVKLRLCSQEALPAILRLVGCGRRQSSVWAKVCLFKQIL